MHDRVSILVVSAEGSRGFLIIFAPVHSVRATHLEVCRGKIVHLFHIVACRQSLMCHLVFAFVLIFLFNILVMIQ